MAEMRKLIKIVKYSGQSKVFCRYLFVQVEVNCGMNSREDSTAPGFQSLPWKSIWESLDGIISDLLVLLDACKMHLPPFVEKDGGKCRVLITAAVPEGLSDTCSDNYSFTRQVAAELRLLGEGPRFWIIELYSSLRKRQGTLF
jgi:hypothetical protein